MKRSGMSRSRYFRWGCNPMYPNVGLYDLTLFDTVRICLCDFLCKFDGFWIEWFRLGNCWNPSMFNKPKLAETKQQRIRWILSTCQALDVMSWSLLQFHSATGNKRLAVPWQFMLFFLEKGTLDVWFVGILRSIEFWSCWLAVIGVAVVVEPI